MILLGSRNLELGNVAVKYLLNMLEQGESEIMWVFKASLNKYLPTVEFHFVTVFLLSQ